jgi:hypothetical protein
MPITSKRGRPQTREQLDLNEEHAQTWGRVAFVDSGNMEQEQKQTSNLVWNKLIVHD